MCPAAARPAELLWSSMIDSRPRCELCRLSSNLFCTSLACISPARLVQCTRICHKAARECICISNNPSFQSGFGGHILQFFRTAGNEIACEITAQGKYSKVTYSLYSDSLLGRWIWHVLTRNRTVLPVIATEFVIRINVRKI